MYKTPTIEDALPIFEPTEAELRRGELGKDRYLSRREYETEPKEFKTEIDIANKLFFSGGNLAQHNRQLKKGVESGKFYGCLKALLSSFAPPHESKMLTAGLFIAAHTESIPSDPNAG